MNVRGVWDWLRASSSEVRDGLPAGTFSKDRHVRTSSFRGWEKLGAWYGQRKKRKEGEGDADPICAGY